MVTVLKIGGSLAEDPMTLTQLCHELSVLAKDHRIIVIPGGGEFADIARKLYKKYGFSDPVAHKMGILSMDQCGLFLSDIVVDSFVTYSLEEIRKSAKGKVPIFLPSTIMFREDPLEKSWDVTSDSIAAYIANLLQAQKLLLVTDVDGIFYEDPKKKLDAKLIEELSAQELLSWNRRTSVDKTLPKILLRTKLDCYVVNGNYPERIRDILVNKKNIDCTHITI
jgi:aspartokinase-like uncharacterized kinase